MIAHNPKSWFSWPFHFHRSDTARRLSLWILAVCAYSGVVAWLELEVWRLSETSHVRNISIMHTLLGFVISFLLVFRTNTAYERWWEGRKLWGGLVNSSRNLAMKLSTMLPADDPQRSDLPEYIQEKLDLEKHIPNQVASLMYRNAQDLLEEKKITGEQLLFINAELQSFTDICGGCERIKNTPIPYSYSVFIKRFIIFYVATLPFGFVFSLGYFVIPIVGFIFYVLASLELIAEEIEEPFGADENDLPLEKMARSIQNHIHEII